MLGVKWLVKTVPGQSWLQNSSDPFYLRASEITKPQLTLEVAEDWRKRIVKLAVITVGGAIGVTVGTHKPVPLLMYNRSPRKSQKLYTTSTLAYRQTDTLA